MQAAELEELSRRRREQMVRLMEVSDLTGQLKQALDRNDQVSVNMMITMRQTPLQQLQEMEESLRAYLLTLPEESAIRAHAILSGSPAEDPEETVLCEQSARYRRLLEAVLAQDRALSIRLGGKRSFYNKFRE